MTRLQTGIVGLGRIGANLALQALATDIRVVAHDVRTPGSALMTAGLEYIDHLDEFYNRLESPRTIFLYIPAGRVVDTVLEQLATVLEPGDIIVDGGNSYWGDSIRRHLKYRREYSLTLMDCGTSGGTRGARNGACFMVGGPVEGYERIAPILNRLAVPGGLVHCGGAGSGHFVKLVHNGIEFGMLQAIGEGTHLLECFREQLPVGAILDAWNHGSVIRCWLIELLEEQYRLKGGLKEIPTWIEDTGEVNWLIEDAMRMEIPIPVITQSVMQLFTSRDDLSAWSRAVAMMRHGFGEHPYGTSKNVADYRRSSREHAWFEETPEEPKPRGE